MDITEDEMQPWWRSFMGPSPPGSQVQDTSTFNGATRFLYGDGSHPASSNIEWDSPPRNVTQPSSPEPRESEPAAAQSILNQTLTTSYTKQENDEKALISKQPSYNKKNAEEYACPLCNAKMTRKSNLKRHLESMHKKCEDLKPCCGLQFSSKYKAQEHYYSVHHNFGYKCVHCSKVFTSASLMLRHLPVHTKLCAYKCNACGYRSAYRGNVLRHIKVKKHHGVVKFSQVESCSNNSLTAHADIDWSAHSNMDFTMAKNSNDSQVDSDQGEPIYYYTHKKFRRFHSLS